MRRLDPPLDPAHPDIFQLIAEDCAADRRSSAARRAAPQSRRIACQADCRYFIARAYSFMLCFQLTPPNAAQCEGRHGSTDGAARPRPGAKKRSTALDKATAPGGSLYIFQKENRSSVGRMGKEIFLQGPLSGNSLISPDSMHEMEGNGTQWKRLSGLGCGRTRIDCAWLSARRAFLEGQRLRLCRRPSMKRSNDGADEAPRP
jgi:hypothetical protein